VNAVRKAGLSDFAEQMADPWWRVTSGAMYKIIDKEKRIVPFRPNAAQFHFLRNMHSRNAIPKARQRGLSTVIQILMLDSALFQDNFEGVVIAQDKDAASSIFTNKLKFAYNNLPDFLLEKMPLQSDSKTEIALPNNSKVTVTTSARSGTTSFLHVSEMGKIAAKFPDKAKEIMTGSIPSVPKNGIVCIESTAEGREGKFFEIVQQAIKLKEAGTRLTPLDFKLHFYSWWDADEYQLDPSHVLITKADHDYFNKLERKIGKFIEMPRRAWYVKTREGFGDHEDMWQEYPSTVDECFMVSTEGTYYAEQFSRARKENRIRQVPHDQTLPVATFWDIGANDETAVWCVQNDRGAFNIINYVEATGEPFSYFVNWLKELKYTWDSHFLPHDALAKRQQGHSNQSAMEMIMSLAPSWNLQIVPRIAETIIGIQQVRDVFPRCWFDAERCKVGLEHLELYRKEWDRTHGCWKSQPRHDMHSNAADAFRQMAQAVANKQWTVAAKFSGTVNQSYGDRTIGL
jgi:hypothetical protein